MMKQYFYISLELFKIALNHNNVKRQKNKINKITNERGDLTNDTIEKDRRRPLKTFIHQQIEKPRRNG